MLRWSAFLVLTAAIVVESSHLHPPSYYEQKFYDWVKEFRVEFENGKEFVHRLKVWATNEDFILTENAKGLSYTLGHNEFSHLTWDEFQERMKIGNYSTGGLIVDEYRSEPQDDFVLRQDAEIPDEIDWVEKGAVTPVKDQGQCGSCWSFSTSGALEGAYYVKTGELVNFSEQELVDCDQVDQGCNGGLMTNAFEWIKNNGGLGTEDSYPYKAVQGSCHSVSSVPGSAIKSYTTLASTDDALTAALARQPVSVGIQANQRSFQFYQSGVFTGWCGSRLDHGVLAVGYGVKDGLPYYKVKNSWSPSWGDQGYIYLQKGKSQRGGQCGILLMASVPHL